MGMEPTPILMALYTRESSIMVIWKVTVECNGLMVTGTKVDLKTIILMVKEPIILNLMIVISKEHI